MDKAKLITTKHDFHVSHRLVSFRNEFERQIETEIMQSEILRARFLAGVFLILAIVGSGLGLFGHQLLLSVQLGALNMRAIVTVLVIYAVYESAFSIGITVFKKRGLKFPFFPKYINALIEITLPSLALLVFLYQFPQELALSLPPVFLYFLFTILAALRLEPGLAVFTGLVAGIEYTLLSLWSIQANPAGLTIDPSTMAVLFPASQIAKATLMVLAGLITAFVSGQIRGRMITSFRSREEQDRVRSIFGQQVSPAVMERLLHQSDAPESESRHVCIMFLDIRNFTSFSQNRDPEEVVEFLNRIWDFMIDIINRHHGIINKFLGDGFMAVFGAPLPDGQSCANAVKAALEISDRLALEIAEGRLIQTSIGIGLHAGNAVTGNVGSRERREYTIIGDVVNLASRIEQLNKQFKSEILMSSEVKESLQNQPELASALVPAKSLGLATVKGRDQQVEIWHLR